jgi:hypothetical protein
MIAAFAKSFTNTMSTIKNKHVHFNLTPIVIYEPDDLAQDLQECRKSDVMQRKADAARFERLLSPILSAQHRNNILTKLYPA